MSASKPGGGDGRRSDKARKSRAVRRRNPLVPVVRGLPMRVEDSAKRYKRHPKHRKRGEGGDA
jgi:hypothetical protein